MAESSGNTNAEHVNGDSSVDRGLMQINSIHADMVGGDLDSLYNPAVNMRVAYSLWSEHDNFTAWNGYTSGRYLAYL